MRNFFTATALALLLSSAVAIADDAPASSEPTTMDVKQDDNPDMKADKRLPGMKEGVSASSEEPQEKPKKKKKKKKKAKKAEVEAESQPTTPVN